MKAMTMTTISPIERHPLTLVDLPIPKIRSDQILVQITVCGVCRTELDEIEGRLAPSQLPIILGHEIVGAVKKIGVKVTKFQEGDRVGITWLNWACGSCSFCRNGYENLCKEAKWTGKDVDGGYAEYTSVQEDFAYPIPTNLSDSEVAPLLCAGVIGYRALKLCKLQNGENLGLYGFGASAHIVIQITKYMYPESKVYVVTRSQAHRKLAEQLGADWTGQTESPPEKVHCAIDFTPVGKTVHRALLDLERGGTLIINAIRKIDSIPELDYARYLWHEKVLKSVANVTRNDALTFLPLAAEIPIRPKFQRFKLEEANEAIQLLKQGQIQGAAVLEIL